jgi:hypothetical protein
MEQLIKARIKWLDNEEGHDVTFKVGDPNEDNDDNIFYYLDYPEQILSFFKEGVEDFVLVSLYDFYKTRDYTNMYTCGNGTVSIAASTHGLPEKGDVETSIEVGEILDEDVTGKDVLGAESRNVTHIRFRNLESLEVLQAAVDRCRETFNKYKK